MTKQKRADLLLLLVTVSWGTSYYLTDICLTQMPPMWLNAFRFLLSFATLGIVFHKSLRKLDRKTLKYSCYVGLALAGSYICFVYGISRTSLSNAAFICALPVLFMPLLDFLVNRTKLSRKLLGCLVLCVCGLGLLTLRDTLMPASGDVISLGVPICYAVDLLLTEKAVKSAGVNALNLGVCQLGVVGVITLIASLLIEEPQLPTTTTTWFSVLFLTFVCTGAALVIQSVQQKYTTASHVGLIFTLEPVFASIVAFFFAHEVLPGRCYIGMTLMLASLLLMEVDLPLWHKSRKNRVIM